MTNTKAHMIIDAKMNIFCQFVVVLTFSLFFFSVEGGLHLTLHRKTHNRKKELNEMNSSKNIQAAEQAAGLIRITGTEELLRDAKYISRADAADVVDFAIQRSIANTSKWGIPTLHCFSCSATNARMLGRRGEMYAERMRRREDGDDDDDDDDDTSNNGLNVWVVPLSALQNVLVLDSATMMTTETDNGNGKSERSRGKRFKLKTSVVIHARNFEKRTWTKCKIVDVVTSKRAIDDIVNAIAGQNIVDVSFEGVVPLRLCEAKGFLKQREVRRIVERAASFVVLKEVIESRDSNVYDLDKHEQRKSSGGNFNNRRSNYSRTKSNAAARRNTAESGTKVSVHAGTKIATIGSPFGVLSPNIFSRLLNRGCISSALVAIANQGTSNNINGVVSPAVSVVDLSIALKPGAEGSPVFLDESTSRSKGPPIVVGILIPPLSFAKERDGGSSRGAFPLMIHAPWIFGDDANNTLDDDMPLTTNKIVSAARNATESVCRVEILDGAHFGSGILISKTGDDGDSSEGIVLTNRHVVLPAIQEEKHSKNAITLRFSNGSWRRGVVQRVSKGPLDLALVRVLSLKNGGSGALPIVLPTRRPARKQRSPAIGDEVLVVAHDDRFGNNVRKRKFDKASPEVNHGYVSKIAGKKTMLVTSASVRSGASGGALIDGRTGHLIGVVTSNARLATRSGGANVYTDVNFIVNVSETQGGIGEIMDSYERDQEVIDAWDLRSDNMRSRL